MAVRGGSSRKRGGVAVTCVASYRRPAVHAHHRKEHKDLGAIPVCSICNGRYQAMHRILCRGPSSTRHVCPSSSHFLIAIRVAERQANDVGYTGAENGATMQAVRYVSVSWGGGDRDELCINSCGPGGLLVATFNRPAACSCANTRGMRSGHKRCTS